MYALETGVIVSAEQVLNEGVDALLDLGVSTLQLSVWDVSLCTPEVASKINALIEGKVSLSAVWCGWPKPAIWNFVEGPLTLGLVPSAYRAERVTALKRGADLAKWLGVEDLTTHLGFIPENPADTQYKEVVIAVREVANYCKERGQFFNFETGQETPTTLMRTIEDVGLDNMGVNLDPANLLLYGKANPVDALDIYRESVRGVHIKDGDYPTNGHSLGQEKPVGEGRVDFPALLAGLKKYGYRHPLTIEREISGEQQRKDIVLAREKVEAWLAEL